MQHTRMKPVPSEGETDLAPSQSIRGDVYSQVDSLQGSGSAESERVEEKRSTNSGDNDMDSQMAQQTRRSRAFSFHAWERNRR